MSLETTRASSGTLVSGALVLAVLLLAVAPADAYLRYNGSPSCDDCHPTFKGRGVLHDVHTNITGTCKLCHTSTGDNPFLNSSGVVGGEGCRGCHGVDNGSANGWGAGLRAHHANAGAPADANGLFCVDCHAGDPSPGAETDLPPYYTRLDVEVRNPCLISTTVGGEDWNGDGKGLDNDGDLLYDWLEDGDCATPIDASTWGRVKALYH